MSSTSSFWTTLVVWPRFHDKAHTFWSFEHYLGKLRAEITIEKHLSYMYFDKKKIHIEVFIYIAAFALLDALILCSKHPGEG